MTVRRGRLPQKGISRRLTLSFYDAAYLVAAGKHGLPLVTGDTRLFKTAAAEFGWVRAPRVFLQGWPSP